MTVVTVDDKGYITDIDGDLPDDAPRSLAVRPPEALTVSRTPEDMVELATRMANALKDIVEKRGLFAVIQGRKFPTVEAWMTIARMDNVVAREARPPVRQGDGSYEAFVELIRLSDGLVIGSASAICGSPDDEPWGGTPAKYDREAKPPRPEHQRRSMAVTRATSRAFRQQYSWIMSLAGYEPTPADEMPGSDTLNTPVQPEGEMEELLGIETRSGTAKAGTGPGSSLDVRTTPDGLAFGFLLDTGKGSVNVIFEDGLAAAILVAEQNEPKRLVGHWCQVKGRVYAVKQAGRRTTYRLRATEFETREYRLPVSDDDRELDAIPL